LFFILLTHFYLEYTELPIDDDISWKLFTYQYNGHYSNAEIILISSFSFYTFPVYKIFLESIVGRNCFLSLYENPTKSGRLKLSKYLPKYIKCSKIFIYSEYPMKKSLMRVNDLSFISRIMIFLQSPEKDIIGSFIQSSKELGIFEPLSDYHKIPSKTHSEDYAARRRNLSFANDIESFVISRSKFWRRYVNYWTHMADVFNLPISYINIENMVENSNEIINISKEKFGKTLISRRAVSLRRSMENELKKHANNELVLTDSHIKIMELYTSEVECFLWDKCSNIRLGLDKYPLSPVNLLIPYYNPNNSYRESEFLYITESHISNRNIDHIYMFIDNDETPPPIEHQKITVVRTNRQPFYSDYFDYANTHLRNKICIIANGDISFDEPSLIHAQRVSDFLVFSLSRYPFDEKINQSNKTLNLLQECSSDSKWNRDFCNEYIGSHDSFIFRAPIDPSIVAKLNFRQNIWGAENVVIEELVYGGIDVANPCGEIKSYHVHCSESRTKTGHRIDPPSVGSRQRFSKARKMSLKDICSTYDCNPIL
jgi:hypothetical protein